MTGSICGLPRSSKALFQNRIERSRGEANQYCSCSGCACWKVQQRNTSLRVAKVQHAVERQSVGAAEENGGAGGENGKILCVVRWGTSNGKTPATGTVLRRVAPAVAKSAHKTEEKKKEQNYTEERNLSSSLPYDALRITPSLGEARKVSTG